MTLVIILIERMVFLHISGSGIIRPTIKAGSCVYVRRKVRTMKYRHTIIFAVVLVGMISFFTVITTTGKTAGDWCYQAFYKLNEGKFDSAEYRLHRALEKDRQYAQAYYGLGLIAEAHFELDDALSFYEQAISASNQAMRDDYKQALYTRTAEFYAALGQMERAHNTIQALCGHFPQLSEEDFRLYENFLMYSSSIATDLSLLSTDRWLNLERLRLCVPAVDDFSPIAALGHLKELSIIDSNLDSLQFLSPMDSLEFLNLRGNLLTDLSTMPNLPNLTELNLSFNFNLYSLDGIQSCSSIQRLYFAYTSISRLEPLAACHHLSRLDISYVTTLTDFSPTKDLPLELVEAAGWSDEEIKTLKEFHPFVKVLL